MKPLIILSLFFLLISCHKDENIIPSNQSNEFKTLQSNTTSTLTDISFLNDNVGVICGEFGFCAKTNDGGKSWTSLNTGINYSLMSTYILDNQNLFVSRNGLYKSNNSGINFTEIGDLSQYNVSIFNIYFRDSNNGFITHARSLKKTVNGGINWIEKYNTGEYYGLTNLIFTSNSIGYASGGRTADQFNEGEIIKTIDNGENWTKIRSTINITSLSFINDTIGYYSTFNKELYKTTNGGISWNKISNLSYLPLSILFINESIGFITTKEGKIIKTTNGGATWEIVYDATTIPITKIIATSEYIYAIGNNGLIIKGKK